MSKEAPIQQKADDARVNIESEGSIDSANAENTEVSVEIVRDFEVGDAVVYPSHGVGKVTAVEKQEIAGHSMELYVVEFVDDKMTLRVPKARAVKAGLRSLCNHDAFENALEILKEKPQSNRGMWSKRAQEYSDKINSGKIEQIAEVLRDLHKNVEHPERSYSERMIYDLAFDRFLAEFSEAKSLSRDDARTKILDILETASILAA